MTMHLFKFSALPLLVVILFGCKYADHPLNGAQVCAPLPQKQCPDDYHCAPDGRCWQNGTDPMLDAGRADMASRDATDASCASTDSDPHNCGMCGHDCLGGGCSGGICQPFVLGIVPLYPNGGGNMDLVDGKIYVTTYTSGTDLWELDANVPGTPTNISSDLGGFNWSFLMDGRIFWIPFSSGPGGAIKSCVPTACSSTTQTIFTYNVSSAGDLSVIFRDTAADEIVYTGVDDSGNHRVMRMSPTGLNQRLITTFASPSSSFGGVTADSKVGRLFFDNSDSQGNHQVMYISTTVSNTTLVAVSPYLSGFARLILANDRYAIWANMQGGNPTIDSSFRVPLPGGVATTPDAFWPGGEPAAGVVDDNYFLGTFYDSTILVNAICRCPVTDCSSPTILFSGQQSPFHFQQDAEAIYWVTTVSSVMNIVKAAK